MTKLNNNVIHYPAKILKFWHSVEFFTPFNLNEVRSRPNVKYQLTEDQLVNKGNNHLPWLSEQAFNKMGGMPSYEYKYNLYLLPFNKNELTKISQEVFPWDQAGIKYFEFEEKFDDQGETCFAQLPLDSKGFPAWDKMSISTLPWALGKLSDRKISELNYKFYKNEQQKLGSEIGSLSSHISNVESTLIQDHVAPGILTAHGLGALFVILKRWAHFFPDHPLSVIIEHIKMTRKKINENLPKQIENKPAENKPDFSEKDSSEEESEKLADINLSEQGSILNSFYIEDLEKVINDITKEKHDLLLPYILGVAKDKRIDLYTKENHSYVTKKLQAHYFNHGRWPVDDKHFMSLMQQFVINEYFHPLDDHLLLSVNGPPGTGKTTLFQDIIAENITRRARVLCEFSSSGAVFTGSLSINFTGSDNNITINLLNEKLLGFEMIVVSSNNAAVENISKELPLKRKLPEKYQKLSYLQPIASKVLSLHKNNEVIPLKPEDKPWGLISIALGNSKNRNQFKDHVFFAPENKEQADLRIKEGENLSIWEWRKQYNGITFHQAKQDFLEADKALRNYLDFIKRLEQLHEKIGNIDVDAYCSEERSALNLLELAKEKIEAHRDELMDQLAKTEQDKFQVLNNLRQHHQFKPNFFQRIFYRAIAKAYREQLNKLSMDWSAFLDKERLLKEKKEPIDLELKEVLDKRNKILKTIEAKENEFSELSHEYCDLLNTLQGIILPPPEGEIENITQLQAFWQNETLNGLRVNLFASALKLHEAWLAEVLNNGNFSGNLLAISKLMSNKRLVNAENELYIWQSLFMWVPVISSTFASIARQFKNVGRKAFGCFLIDEAGQAIPQAAVGALWRAKQALIVGDPMQIEPVFTTPPNLIEGFAEHLLKEKYEQWLPTITSVQTLADNANFLGTHANMTDKNQWIGCPLRVHRRCLDPMFSVANQIAYDHKMINARTHHSSLTKKYFLGNSCWYHLTGETTDKQYVPVQGELLLNLMVTLYENEHQLPKLYIITPFKRIKQNLQTLIGNSNHWSRYLTTACKLASQDTLRKWCTQNIGTVHTFQGKEADSVIFILGADEKTLGAVNWASSKANLLNVALTRAKDRIYIIGDYELWSRKKYFSELAQSLPVLNK